MVDVAGFGVVVVAEVSTVFVVVGSDAFEVVAFVVVDVAGVVVVAGAIGVDGSVGSGSFSSLMFGSVPVLPGATSTGLSTRRRFSASEIE